METIVKSKKLSVSPQNKTELFVSPNKPKRSNEGKEMIMKKYGFDKLKVMTAIEAENQSEVDVYILKES